MVGGDGCGWLNRMGGIRRGRVLGFSLLDKNGSGDGVALNEPKSGGKCVHVCLCVCVCGAYMAMDGREGDGMQEGNGREWCTIRQCVLDRNSMSHIS